MVFSSDLPFGDTINEARNIVNRTENLLKVPTGLEADQLEELNLGPLNTKTI